MGRGLPATIGQLPNWDRRKARLTRIRLAIAALEQALERNDFRYPQEREAAERKIEKLKAEKAEAVEFIAALQRECEELTSA